MQLVLITLVSQLLIFGQEVQCKIEPTKFQNNRVYALENQHTGKYLTAGEKGRFLRDGDHGTPTLNQRWRFKLAKNSKSGQEGWELVPVNGEPGAGTVWNEIYVGHGKFQFKSTSSQKCLEASSRGVEVPCVREDLFQRWYPHPLAE